MPIWLIWLMSTVLFGIVEILSVHLLAMWFAIGSFVAMILALLGVPIEYQLIVAILVSVLLLRYTRPIVARAVKVERKKTGIEQYVGKAVLVKVPINNLLGEGIVKVGGEEWPVLSVDDSEIQAGCQVEILEIKGIKLIVKKINF